MENKPSLRILQVHNFYQIPGGEDTVVANEKKMLENHGHIVIQYNRSNLEINDFSIIRKLFLPLITIFNPKTYNDIRKIIHKQHIDIVHIHNTMSLISPAVYYASISCGIPVVQTIHNFRLLCPGATLYRNDHICEDCIKYGLKCATKYGCYRNSKIQTLICSIALWFHRRTGIYGKINYICLTEFNKNKMLSLKQINPERIFIKPNFCNNDKINEITPYLERKKQFIFVGRLDKLKGIDILLKSWKYMDVDCIDLLVLGIGPMEKWCKEFIESNKLKNVKILGFLSNSQAREMMADSMALILPTQWYEGFPMTIVEAYSVGTPVIGSDLGNVGVLIKDGITGKKIINNRLIEIKNIKNVLNDKMYMNAKSEFDNNYTEAHNYEQLMMIYQNLKII